MNKFCSKCGNIVNESDNFCGYCRNSLNDNNINNAQNIGVNNVPNNINQNANVNYTNVSNNVSSNIGVSNNTVKTNGLAIAGFVMSLVSPTLCCGLLSLPSLIISIIGLVKINKTKENGKGLAIAGIIISALVLVVYVLYLILVFANLIDTSDYITTNGFDV